MRVHNWYADLLLSSTFFLNNKILKDFPINSFQFNIGNSSFQLDYNPNFKLPAAIVNFESARPSNSRPNIFQFNNMSNINVIPVLHNQDRDITLELQEEHFVINFSVNINCESQLQALEIKHLIESFVPTGKYLHLYEFTSFFNIDDQLLVPCLFDVNKHKIDNLFLRHNRYMDKVEYSFSVQYNPLMRINDINLSIGDTNDSAFQITISFEALTPMPYFLIFPTLEKREFQINRPGIKIPIGDKDYIALNIQNIENRQFITNEVIAIDEILKTKVFTFKGIDDIIINGTLKYDIDKEITDISLEGVVDNKIFKSNAQIIKDISDNTLVGTLVNETISGKFSDIVLNQQTGKLTAWFEMLFDGKVFNNRFTLDFITSNISKTVKDIKLTTDGQGYFLYFSRNIKTKDIYSVLNDVNNRKTSINTSSSKVIGYILDDRTEILFKDRLTIQSDSFFSNVNLSGLIDLDKGIIGNFTTSINNLDQLLFDFVFDYQPCGTSTIERITLDFRAKNETISEISPITLKDYSNTLKNFLVDRIVAIEIENKRFQFDVFVDNINIHRKQFYWKFIFFNNVVTDSHRTEILLETDLSTSTKLVFSTTESFFRNYLNSISNLNPLLFAVFG